MSAAVGTLSASKEIGFNKSETKNEDLKDDMKNKKFVVDEEEEAEAEKNDYHEDDDDDYSECTEHDEEDDAKLKPAEKELDLGPQLSLKEQLEKDKDDESLRRWKEQLLGSVDMSAVGESKEAEVKIIRLALLCPGKPDIIMFPNPIANSNSNSKAKAKAKNNLFILREGNRYRLKFSFTVSNNIVSGLKYTNTVWKAGIRVDNRKLMLGTFSPQKEAYTFELEEETTPSGYFARGSYSARTKFVDDDGKTYLDLSYQFEIQKNCPSSP